MAEATTVYEPFGRDTWRDPFPLYAALRDHDPVHRSPRGFWVLTRFDDVWAAARDTATFSSAQGLTFRNELAEMGLAPTMVMMDPPDHTRYRRLVARGFTPRQVADMEDGLRAYVRGRVDALVAAGGGDAVADLAAPVPNWVVSEYLGVPEEDRHQFGRWTEAIVQGVVGGEGPDAGAAVVELYGYFTELIERRRREPADDLVTLLVQADDSGAGIGLEGILGYAFVMIAGGNDTATGLLAGSLELLAENPEQRARLLAEPELVPNAVEELLRLTSPVQGLCRVTTADVEVDGTTIAEGERVLLCYGSANRDPRQFGDDAEVLDVGRRIDRFLTFSAGAHYCLGASAARLQGRLVLEELLARSPSFAVDVGAGVYADGSFTRRHRSLPIAMGPPSDRAGSGRS